MLAQQDAISVLTFAQRPGAEGKTDGQAVGSGLETRESGARVVVVMVKERRPLMVMQKRMKSGRKERKSRMGERIPQLGG